MSTLEAVAEQGVQDLAGKYLTFQLDSEIYGLAILNVQEIIGIMAVTRVPRTPDFIRGVINLRGRVIPVIDFRLKFSLPAAEDSERTCIIVVQVKWHDTLITIGIIVDEVSEVLNVQGEQIENTPEFGANVNTEFILGIGKVNGRIIMLLDVEKALTTGDFDALTAAAGSDD